MHYKFIICAEFCCWNVRIGLHCCIGAKLRQLLRLQADAFFRGRFWLSAIKKKTKNAPNNFDFFFRLAVPKILTPDPASNSITLTLQYLPPHCPFFSYTVSYREPNTRCLKYPFLFATFLIRILVNGTFLIYTVCILYISNILVAAWANGDVSIDLLAPPF